MFFLYLNYQEKKCCFCGFTFIFMVVQFLKYGTGVTTKCTIKITNDDDIE